MAREIGKEIICKQTVDVIKIAVKESIDRIEESKSEKCVRATILYSDINNNIIQTDSYSISGDKYDLLMSEYPSFAPQKPANEYREVDLWYIIDLIRNGQ